MRKIFTAMAAAAMMFTASAADFSYTVDPAEGQVSMLQFITVTFPNLDEIDIDSEEDIYITRNGATVRGVDVSVTNGNELSFVLGAEQTEAATYLVTIGAEALYGYAERVNGAYTWEEPNEEDIVLTYTIGSAQSGDGMNWTFMVDPEADSEIEELSQITLYFPEIEEVEVISKDDITLTWNGKVVSGIKKASLDEQTITITPAEPLTAPGEYVLSIPAYSLGGANYSEELFEDNPEDIELKWTIAGTQSETLDFSCTPSISTEGFIAYFDGVTLDFTNLESVSYSGSGLTVSKDGEALEGVNVTTDANKLTIALKEGLNFVEGNLEILFAPESLSGVADGVTASNAEEVSLTYKMATPVEFNLEATFSNPKPNADGQISAEKQLTAFFFQSEVKGLVAAAGTEANVTIKEVEGDFEAKGHLRSGKGLNANYSYFSVDFGTEPKYNGIYTITIEKGAFGTEAWSVDPNYGHTNNTIELNFELVDGADYTVYNVEPISITPAEGAYATAEEIATVTLKFAEGIAAVEGASATLAGTTSSYTATAEFKADADGGYSVTFETLPTEDGRYMFTVNQGAFGDADFIADGKGKASMPISIEYVIDKTIVGVAGIDAEAADAEIYTVQGIRLAVPVEQLPAGLYIINGKKVIIK